MSVYRDTNANVVFEHPHPGPLTAYVYRENGTVPILTAPNITPVAGKYTLPLTWVETAFDGKLSITWSDADDFERTQRIDVVTPLVSLSRLRTLFEGENKSDEELSELENTVRVFIEAYCRQDFGFFIGSRQFRGTGNNTIMLEQRLNKLTAFSGGWPGYLKISSDGWTLTVVPENLLDLKQAPPEELLTGNTFFVGGVIRVPEQYIRRFNEGTVYTVTGEWGYDTVPDEVQEAAMLLANDFACSEVLYRDRYLESIKIQQDTITYSPGAFRGTGNARADLLLAKYRRSGMVII
jgi:hypothetical protein